jgi:hypothetical protein
MPGEPTVTCPQCQTLLRLRAAVPPGKALRCPHCSAVFTPAGPQAITEARPLPPPAPVQVPRTRPRPAEDDEDWEEEEIVRKPRRQKKVKRGNAALLWGLIGGGALLLILAGVLVLVLVLRRQSNYEKHEALAREAVQVLEQLAVTMESVKDQDSARTAATGLNRVCDQLESLADRAKALPRLKPDEDRRLQTQFDPELKRLQQRIQQVAFQAGMNSRGEPAFLAAAQRMMRVGMKLQNFMK